MKPTNQLQLLMATFAGWVGLHQSHAITYLIEEIRVPEEQLESSGKRILFTDDQRRRLATNGKPLGRGDTPPSTRSGVSLGLPNLEGIAKESDATAFH